MTRRTIEFHRVLDADNILRVRFDVERGQVLKFVVQLESRFGPSDNWIPVVRYDTAHGFAHLDRLHPYQEAAKIAMSTRNYNEALRIAMDDLSGNWMNYRRRYEEWLKAK